MGILKNIFGNKDKPILNYQDFWNWFQKNERTFFKAVKNGKNIEKDFFDKLSPKLEELKDGFFYVTGMYDDNTVELIFTPDGIVLNIVFVEELVNSAPAISGWKFTSLKPPLDIKDVRIEMADYVYDKDSLSFYSNEYSEYPDEIDITIVHEDYNQNDSSTITNGTYIFLDNFLGELNSLTSIDNLEVIGKKEAKKELIPIDKLKDFLIWREKEFLEKYEGSRYNTENDNYSSIEAELNNGRPLVAIVNSTLLNWNAKASHPWILRIEIKFDGDDNNGMPDNETYELMNKFEKELMKQLIDFEGYLNIGRQTADNLREVYFACKDFRKPSKLLPELIMKYSNRLEISFDIYKDKYWQSFERFRHP